jgi:hypothetical protein
VVSSVVRSLVLVGRIGVAASSPALASEPPAQPSDETAPRADPPEKKEEAVKREAKPRPGDDGSEKKSKSSDKRAEAGRD